MRVAYIEGDFIPEPKLKKPTQKERSAMLTQRLKRNSHKQAIKLFKQAS